MNSGIFDSVQKSMKYTGSDFDLRLKLNVLTRKSLIWLMFNRFNRSLEKWAKGSFIRRKCYNSQCLLLEI